MLIGQSYRRLVHKLLGLCLRFTFWCSPRPSEVVGLLQRWRAWVWWAPASTNPTGDCGGKGHPGRSRLVELAATLPSTLALAMHMVGQQQCGPMLGAALCAACLGTESAPLPREQSGQGAARVHTALWGAGLAPTCGALVLAGTQSWRPNPQSACKWARQEFIVNCVQKRDHSHQLLLARYNTEE